MALSSSTLQHYPSGALCSVQWKLTHGGGKQTGSTSGDVCRHKDHLAELLGTLNATIEWRQGAWWLVPYVPTSSSLLDLSEDAAAVRARRQAAAGMVAAIRGRARWAHRARQRLRAAKTVDLETLLVGTASLHLRVCPALTHALRRRVPTWWQRLKPAPTFTLSSWAQHAD